MRPRPAYIGPGRGTKKVPPVEAASKFLLLPAPMIVAVVPMMVARIVGEVAMMITRIVAVVAMMITRIVAVVAMMVVAMMVAVPSCGWDRAAGRDCADNAQCRSNFR